jgi:GMP synthase-like glutamine amidotransferase
MSLRVCILETDILRPGLIDQYQGYGQMFKRLFSKQPIAAEFVVYNVVQGEYPSDAEVFDAYLVTGSKADSFGTDPWIQTLKTYLLQRYERGDKLLGICFGHQLLALLLGGKTERASKGWGMGIHDYKLDAKAPWMSPEVPELTLLISHQDQVTSLPDNATVIASSDFCPFAARCCASKATRNLSTTIRASCWRFFRQPSGKRFTRMVSPAWSATTTAPPWRNG